MSRISLDITNTKKERSYAFRLFPKQLLETRSIISKIRCVKKESAHVQIILLLFFRLSLPLQPSLFGWVPNFTNCQGSKVKVRLHFSNKLFSCLNKRKLHCIHPFADSLRNKRKIVSKNQFKRLLSDRISYSVRFECMLNRAIYQPKSRNDKTSLLRQNRPDFSPIISYVINQHISFNTGWKTISCLKRCILQIYVKLQVIQRGEKVKRTLNSH